MTRKFIKEAIQHPGALRHYAQHEGCLNSDGTINTTCARKHAETIRDPKERLHRIREINFAQTLGTFHHHGTSKMERSK